MKGEFDPIAEDPVFKMKAEIDRLRAENARLVGEVEALKKQAKIDNEDNQDWINSLCEQLCKMEDALGFKNDCYDKQGKWTPTIGPWLERLRDLLASEGELGDAKEEIEKLKIQKDEARVASDFANLACERKDSDLQRHKQALEKARMALEYCETFVQRAPYGELFQLNSTQDALRHIDEVLK